MAGETWTEKWDNVWEAQCSNDYFSPRKFPSCPSRSCSLEIKQSCPRLLPPVRTGLPPAGSLRQGWEKCSQRQVTGCLAQLSIPGTPRSWVLPHAWAECVCVCVCVCVWWGTAERLLDRQHQFHDAGSLKDQCREAAVLLVAPASADSWLRWQCGSGECLVAEVGRGGQS
jgi:hypothetical protein